LQLVESCAFNAAMESSSYISDRKSEGLVEAKRAAELKTGLKGNTALAKALDDAVSPQAISQWDHVPLARVFDVERATGIPRHLLRPDFFGDAAA
jgi:hypothetical protein